MQKGITTAAALALLLVGPATFAQSIVPGNTTPLTGTVVGSSSNGSAGATQTSVNSNAPAALSVALATAPNIAIGDPNAVLALIQLDARASGQNIQVVSIPMTFAFTGTIPAQYTNCALRNVNNITTPLNTGAYSISALSPTSALFRFNNPIIVPAGGVIDLALTCTVASNAQPGQIQVGLNLGTIAGTSPSGVPVTSTPAVGPTGQSLATYGIVTVTAAGTGTGTGSGAGVPNTGGTGTPGIPNTGAGGDAPLNDALLGLSGAIALFGAYTLARRTVLR